jgi:hypothetical protein
LSRDGVDIGAVDMDDAWLSELSSQKCCSEPIRQSEVPLYVGETVKRRIGEAEIMAEKAPVTESDRDSHPSPRVNFRDNKPTRVKHFDASNSFFVRQLSVLLPPSAQLANDWRNPRVRDENGDAAKLLQMPQLLYHKRPSVRVLVVRKQMGSENEEVHGFHPLLFETGTRRDGDTVIFDSSAS